MRPLRLELRNFLAYRAPAALNLRELRLACLSGVNGAGKSSLLDAITWALWGQARARRDEDLIHQRADEMYVQLDFEQEGREYRVLRRRQRAGRSASRLRLYRRANGEYEEISAPNIPATEARLRQLLRLDYETFTHSAFLLQGRADAFTARSPRERQQVLARILRLERWQMAAARAREKEQAAAAQAEQLAARRQEIAGELARGEEVANALVSAEREHQQAQAALQQAETDDRQWRDAAAALRQWQSDGAAARSRQSENQRDLAAAERERQRWQERRAALRDTLADREQIEQGYAALSEARAADQALSRRLANLREQDAEIARLERQLSDDRHALSARRDQLSARLAEMERAAAAYTDPESAAVAERIRALEQLAPATASLRQQDETWQDERRQRESANRSLREEMAQLRAQMDTLQDAEAVAGAACPLCGQPLSAEHRAQALAALATRGRDKGDAFRENRAWLREHAASPAGPQLRENERALLALPELKARAREIARRQQEGAENQQRQAAMQAEREQLAARLDADDFSAETRQQLARARKRRAQLGEDQADAAARLSDEELASMAARHSQLVAADAALPEVEAALAAAEERRAKIAAASAESERALAAWQAAETRLRQDVAEARRAELALQEARVRERQAHQELLSLRQQQAAFAQLEQRGRQLTEEWQAAETERQRYAELRRAFGADGIPALLIEAAIPEIQAEANALLEQLSDAPLRLALRLARRGPYETLEIRARDEWGERGYELFSGGEAFRIHFALRVALARLLARRAGTKLRVLFIDEGFGTQDGAGRERLVRALTAIQNEFSLILVITHLEELRAAFPRQIIVEPGAEGSQLRLR